MIDEVLMVAGLIAASLSVFLLISFLSTRIIRDPKFPVREKITVLDFEIDGKRYIVAPPARNILESFDIILKALLWVVFKIGPIQYKSSSSRIVFGTSVGLAIALTLGCGISSAYAILGHSSHDNQTNLAQTKPTQPVLTETQPADGTAAPPPPPPTQSKNTHTIPPVVVDPEKQGALTKSTNNTNKVSSDKRSTTTEKSHPTAKPRPTARPRITVQPHIETTERNNVRTNTAGDISRLKNTIESVEVDGRRVLDTVDPDKIAGTVKDAIRNGATNINITLHIGQ